MILNIRVKNLSWVTLNVCKIMNLLLNFSINTTCKHFVLLIFTHLSKKKLENLKSGCEGKKWRFIFVFSRRKANWILKLYFWYKFRRQVLWSILSDFQYYLVIVISQDHLVANSRIFDKSASELRKDIVSRYKLSCDNNLHLV